MSQRSSNAPAPQRILLVDDNKDGNHARMLVLKELGYEVEATTCARNALTLLGETHFDLVVTDYRMPEMNGAEFIRKIKAAQPGTPVILLSGFVDALGLDEGATGADAVIMKSAREVPHLLREARVLLNAGKRRKPLAKAARPARARKRAASG